MAERLKALERENRETRWEYVSTDVRKQHRPVPKPRDKLSDHGRPCGGPSGKGMASKIYSTPEAALDGVTFDGMTLMSGGFGLTGNPENLITALLANGVGDLTVISNNCGADGFGLWKLLNNSSGRALREIPARRDPGRRRCGS